MRRPFQLLLFIYLRMNAEYSYDNSNNDSILSKIWAKIE